MDSEQRANVNIGIEPVTPPCMHRPHCHPFPPFPPMLPHDKPDELMPFPIVGLEYQPMFIKQRADYNFGETITHEDYNARFNMLADTLDDHTRILMNIFYETNQENVYHIPYLDIAIKDLTEYTKSEVARLDDRITTEVDRLDGRIDDLKEEVDKNTTNIEKIFGTLADHENRLEGIVNGDIVVEHAHYAEQIYGVDEVGPYMYYGTDKDDNPGFHRMPPAIFADDLGEHEKVNPRDVDGIYYTPGSDSVSESMLTPEVREKLNDKGVTSYPQLSQLPSINNVTLLGNRTLTELGIQPAGNYLTSIPSIYVQRPELDNYVTNSSFSEALNNLSSSTSTATDAKVKAVQDDLNNYKSTVSKTYNRIGVNTKVANPIKGDLYITV